MALSGHCYVVCVKRRSPSFSGSQQQSNPIRVRRWWQASGLFNSPPNDIRASWSALMITHSTNLSLHQHPLHKGPAWAKRVCVCVCVWPYFATKDCLSAVLPQGLHHSPLSLLCSNATSDSVTKDALQRLLCLSRKHSEGAWLWVCVLEKWVFEPCTTKED